MKHKLSNDQLQCRELMSVIRQYNLKESWQDGALGRSEKAGAARYRKVVHEYLSMLEKGVPALDAAREACGFVKYPEYTQSGAYSGPKTQNRKDELKAVTLATIGEFE